MPISIDFVPSQGMEGRRDRIGFLMLEERTEGWRTLMRGNYSVPSA